MKSFHLIPNVGDWVECRGKDSHGKVTEVRLDKGTFVAGFFTEWSDYSDIGGTEEDEERISNIVAIVTNQEKIRELEEEISGKLAKKLKEEGW